MVPRSATSAHKNCHFNRSQEVERSAWRDFCTGYANAGHIVGGSWFPAADHKLGLVPRATRRARDGQRLGGTLRMYTVQQNQGIIWNILADYCGISYMTAKSHVTGMPNLWIKGLQRDTQL